MGSNLYAQIKQDRIPAYNQLLTRFMPESEYPGANNFHKMSCADVEEEILNRADWATSQNVTSLDNYQRRWPQVIGKMNIGAIGNIEIKSTCMDDDDDEDPLPLYTVIRYIEFALTYPVLFHRIEYSDLDCDIIPWLDAGGLMDKPATEAAIRKCIADSIATRDELNKRTERKESHFLKGQTIVDKIPTTDRNGTKYIGFRYGNIESARFARVYHPDGSMLNFDESIGFNTKNKGIIIIDVPLMPFGQSEEAIRIAESVFDCLEKTFCRFDQHEVLNIIYEGCFQKPKQKQKRT